MGHKQDEVETVEMPYYAIAEELDQVYADPKNHIYCLIPTYYNGGDSTICHYVDGREKLVEQPARYVMAELAADEGLRLNRMVTSDGRRSHYTSPRTYGPHMTFAFIKCRQSIGKDVVYGLFNVAIPYKYHVTPGPDSDTSYIKVADFEPILVCQAPNQVIRKLNEAMVEHCQYVRKMLARIKLSRNPQIVAEFYVAWRDLTR